MFQTTLVERLGLMESFNTIQPSTMQGKVIYDKYGKMLESSESVTHFHNFMLECLSSNDLVLRNWAQLTSNNISVTDKAGWKFNLVMEQLESTGVALNEVTVDHLNYLRYFTEDQLCEAIAGGAFKKEMHIPELKAMYESLVNANTARKLQEGHIQYNPISYVESKGGKKYFALDHKIYEDGPAGIVAATNAPSANFNAVSSAIATIPFNPEVDEFELDFLPGAVNVNTHGEISKDKESWDVQKVNDMVKAELEDPKLPQEQKMQEARKCDLFNILMENFDSLVRLDNITAVTNAYTKKTVYLVEHSTGNYILTESGIVNKSNSLHESLGVFMKYSGVNIRPLFESKLLNESQVQGQISETTDKIAEDIKKYQDLVAQCNEEQKFCEEGSEKYKEFENIKQQATGAIDILKQTQKELG